MDGKHFRFLLREFHRIGPTFFFPVSSSATTNKREQNNKQQTNKQKDRNKQANNKKKTSL